MERDFETFFKMHGRRIHYQDRFRLIDVQRKKIPEQEVADRAEKEEKLNIDTENS